MKTPSFINGWTKEKVISHIKNNFRGISKDNIKCLYRGPNNKKCAIGLFIPDEIYDKRMEGFRVDTLIKDFPKVAKYMPLESEILVEFQSIHDSEFCSLPLDVDVYIHKRLITFIEQLE